MKSLLIVTCQISLITLGLCSCQDGVPSIQASPATDAPVNVVPADLLGIWEEAVDTTQPYFGYHRHRVSLLANDSFNIKIKHVTDAVEVDDPCGFQWTYYASGQIVDEDTLIDEAAARSEDKIWLFRGNHTDSLYTHREPNCRGEEEFSRLFSMEQPTSDTLSITFYRADQQGNTWENNVSLVRAED